MEERGEAYQERWLGCSCPSCHAVFRAPVESRGKKVECPSCGEHVAIPEADEPVFAFAVHADVTDTTGETRSDGRIVNVGYVALRATLDADAWQTADAPVRLSIRTDSLGGEPEPATGLSVAAHRSLAFGTVLRVRNPQNGRTVRVVVNDRGPFVAGRVLDLSRRAAEELDFVREGVVEVEIEILEVPG